MGKEKRPSPRQLFVERMKREGREKEWHERVKEKMRETGKAFHGASYIVMREMGYESAEKEREYQEKYIRNLHRTAEQQQIAMEKAQMIEEQEAFDFESALNSLPDRAADKVELDWISAHPAMTRKNRQKDKTKDIILDVNDVLHAPHGKAPSKSAVIALQEWVNAPREFFKQLLGEQKKQVEENESAKHKETDEDLSEVQALLAEVRRGK